MTDTTPRVWILDSSLWETIRVYATEKAARSAAEQYVHDEAARQPVTNFDWRFVPDDTDGLHELWGMAGGRMLPANMIIYPLPVLGADPTRSDGDQAA